MPRKASPSSSPSFIADSMLGDVARWLRLLGFDCLYNSSLHDDQLLEIAWSQCRVLLTRDKDLHRRALAKGAVSILVNPPDITQALKQISEELQILLLFDERRSRCPRCNAPLKIVSREEVAGRVPEGILSRYSKFWVCTNPECGKVYWIGSHWRTIRRVLSNLNT